ncbi:MAG: hypothetical protein ACN4G0_07890 [Polyangiales bacterium]
MEPKKSQGPSVAALAGTAVLLCVVLVGVALWVRDDGKSATADGTPIAASTLQPLYDRCESELSQDVVNGRNRTRCNRTSHPAFMLEVLGTADQIDEAKMLVPLGGSMNKLLDRMLVGLEMFGLVAGLRADLFMPKEHTDGIGTSKTSLVYEGRVYATQPITGVGLMFAVGPEESAPSRSK